MRSTDTQSVVLSDFMRTFDHFNAKLFEGSLAACVFEPTTQKFGIRYDLGDRVYRIGAGLARLTYRDILAGLLHEMIHAFNHQNGISDHTPNQYHNKAFALAALRVGFHVKKHQTRGWSLLSFKGFAGSEHLSPDEDDSEYLMNVVDRVSIDLDALTTFQQEITASVSSVTRKQFQLKYECACPPPHNTIRSGRRPSGRFPLHVRCDVCHSPFVLAREELQEAL